MQAAAERVLKAEGANGVIVAADGTLSPPQRVEGIAVTMASAQSVVIQRSLLPDMVRVAEEVAEGDIESPTRGAPTPVATVAPQVRIAEIVPRGSIAAQIIAGAQAVVQASVPSTAESFLGSRSAALAVVGARLQRTRITGSPGAAPQAPLSINTQLSRPFTIKR